MEPVVAKGAHALLPKILPPKKSHTYNFQIIKNKIETLYSKKDKFNFENLKYNLIFVMHTTSYLFFILSSYVNFNFIITFLIILNFFDNFVFEILVINFFIIVCSL